MANSLLEILEKCERRLSKKAQRQQLSLQINHKALFEQAETTQAEHWQRLFIATIQLHLESQALAPSTLDFLSSQENHISITIKPLSPAFENTENGLKLINACAAIDEASLICHHDAVELQIDLTPLIASDTQVKKQILCADDNPDNRQVIKLLLEKMGHEVSLAENGKEALEATLSTEFDLIFLDIQMPVMDGLEALELIRSTACDSPIIAFTAQVFDHEVEHLLSLGFNAWLAKPIDRQKLDEILMEFLQQKANSQQLEIDDDILNQLKQDYQISLNQYLVEVQAAADQHNKSDMAKLAHALKGSGGNFGFDDITKVAGDLEQACKTAQTDWPTNLTSHLLQLLNQYKM